jgi:hypothetical protein
MKTRDFLGNVWDIDCMGCAISNGSMLVPGGLIRAAHHAIKQETRVEYLTMVQEESSIHFHLWFFPWATAIIEQYGQPSLTKIREIMVDMKKHAIGAAEWKELEKSIDRIKARRD